MDALQVRSEYGVQATFCTEVCGVGLGGSARCQALGLKRKSATAQPHDRSLEQVSQDNVNLFSVVAQYAHWLLRVVCISFSAPAAQEYSFGQGGF